MNERIEELKTQAFKLAKDKFVGNGPLDFCNNEEDHEIFLNRLNYSYKKFAELIVLECAKSANDWYQNHDKIHSDPMSYVLAHFGVEE